LFEGAEHPPNWPAQHIIYPIKSCLSLIN
jgi:hypothetical protein